MPKARSERLLVERLEGETVVYDLENDTAHCLSPIMAAVWLRCDGRTTVDRIPALVTEELGQTVSPGLVWLALTELSRADLLDAEIPLPVELHSLTRRRMLQRLGLAGAGVAAASLIASVAVPEAAAALSCVPAGHPCDPGQGNGGCCGSCDSSQSPPRCV